MCCPGIAFDRGVLYFYFTAHLDDWKRRAACTERITGILKKKSAGLEMNRHIQLNCMFCYTYRGKKYTSLSLDEPSHKVFQAYKEGESYPIYLNPDNPHQIRCWSLEGKSHFLLDGLRNLLFIISIPNFLVPPIVNLQNGASWSAWLYPAFFFLIFIGCIISFNTDKTWKD